MKITYKNRRISPVSSGNLPNPFIFYIAMQSWEYMDLLPDDTFDINPFDIEIENLPDGRLAYERLTDKLLRIKSTLALFDDSGSLWDLFCENTTILINDPYQDDRFNQEVDKETGYQTRSILCIPVTNSKGDVIGAYQAINKMDDQGYWYFDDRDEKRLAMAAVFCGKTLESQILYSESQLDQLTGLKNRRGYYEYYEKNVHPYLLKQSCSIVMADIDFFKRVNDTYGHNAGDVVLKCIASILRNMAGTSGEVIRWGGEEFVILLKECAVSQAAAFAENVRKKVESSICYFEDVPIRVTMSFGVKALDSHLSPEENVKGVDEKLFVAIPAGRNRVAVDEI